MFRTRSWVPGRAVPWGLGRLPWAPGAPPRGSQGGVPAPNYKAQSPLSTLWIRIKIYIDFDIDFWSSWGRSWVPLGGHFRSCWRLFRPQTAHIGPGPPPLGPWGASQGLPGGGPGPKLQGSIRVNPVYRPFRIRIEIYVDFDIDF